MSTLAREPNPMGRAVGDVMGKVRLSKPSIGKEECESVSRVLLQEYLGMGVETRLFEEDIRAFLDTDREVICVNTGTAALHLALQAIGVGPGDEVIVPSITYVASFQAISATGAAPVPCDVLSENVLLDVEDAARRITPRTKAIMAVQYASNPAGMKAIYGLARQHDLLIVEDAAQSIGCISDGRRVGCAGDIVCFSFDGVKTITSGEGGAVVTADRQLARRIRSASLLGVDHDAEARFQNRRAWTFDITNQGYRYHMSNVMAAIGRTQLRKFDSLASRRIAQAKAYVSAFNHLPGISLLAINYDDVVPYMFPLRIVGGRRARVRIALDNNAIEWGFHYAPNHKLSLYAQPGLILPVSELLAEELITLPLHPDLTPEEQSRVIDTVESALVGQ